MNIARPFLAVVTGIGCASCGDPLTPLARVSSELEASASTAMPGDTLLLRVIVTNRGARQVSVGVGCGAGFDVDVRAPDGGRGYLVRGQVSICPLFDSNILEPGETDSVSFRWKVPVVSGTYILRGGVQVPDGLGAVSPPRSVVVR